MDELRETVVKKEPRADGSSAFLATATDAATVTAMDSATVTADTSREKVNVADVVMDKASATGVAFGTGDDPFHGFVDDARPGHSHTDGSVVADADGTLLKKTSLADSSSDGGFGDFGVTSKAAPTVDNDDGFGDFGVTSKAAPAAVNDGGFGYFNVTSKAAPSAVNDGGFGDFGVTSKAAPSAGNTNDDGFGDFGMPSKAPPTVDNDDGFGDFGVTPKAAPTVDNDDGFGDFNVTPKAAPAAVDDVGFGDFSTTAQTAPTDDDGFGDFSVTSRTAPIADDDDDDGFGDFSATAASSVPATTPMKQKAETASVPMPLPHITRDAYTDYLDKIKTSRMTEDPKAFATALDSILGPAFVTKDTIISTEEAVSGFGLYERNPETTAATNDTSMQSATPLPSTNIPSTNNAGPLTRPFRSIFSTEPWYDPLMRIQFESAYPENSINKLRWRRCMIRKLSLISLNVPLDESAMH